MQLGCLGFELVHCSHAAGARESFKHLISQKAGEKDVVQNSICKRLFVHRVSRQRAIEKEIEEIYFGISLYIIIYLTCINYDKMPLCY